MAATIDEVVDEITEIVDWAGAAPSRLGFFAALYRGVTIQVRDDIAAGKFADPDRMERLDVVFANRYLDAMRAHRAGSPASRCWDVAFEAAGVWRLLIVQQLLIGINAHINLDLGIAAAEVGGDALADLEPDFMAINDVLAGMVGGVVATMGELSPWIGLLDRVGGRTERKIINFSLDKARDEAWAFAGELAAMGREGWPAAKAAKDLLVADLGRFIWRPGPKLAAAAYVIKLREVKDIPTILAALAR